MNVVVLKSNTLSQNEIDPKLRTNDQVILGIPH